MSKEVLKHCPFCGGDARISADTEATRDSEGRLWAFTVVCDRCCATSGLTFSPDRAKEAWNNRKPMQEIVLRLEDYPMWKDFMIYDLAYRERRIVKKAISIVKEVGGVDE